MNVKVKKFEVEKTEVRDYGYELLWNVVLCLGGVYISKNGDNLSYHSYDYDGRDHLEYLNGLTQGATDHNGVTYIGDCDIPVEDLLAFLKSNKIQYDTHVGNPEFKNKLEEATEAARKLFEAAGLEL